LKQRDFRVTTEKDNADAVLKLSLKKENGKPVVEVRLVNRQGDLLLNKHFDDIDQSSLAEKIAVYLFEERENHKGTKSRKNY
jgi:hypothetical protein